MLAVPASVIVTFPHHNKYRITHLTFGGDPIIFNHSLKGVYMRDNPVVNYAKINMETNSQQYNVRDIFKTNTYEQNVTICQNDRLPFSVGLISITGELNVGMMIRSACLMGAENVYIFGRNKFDKRSTVGAEKYINIVQYTYDDPLHADELILHQLSLMPHSVVLCEQGGWELGQDNSFLYDTFKQSPMFVFGSESHGIPECITESHKFPRLSIPQRGVLRSFNVSAAMAIMCWDYLKERHL